MELASIFKTSPVRCSSSFLQIGGNLEFQATRKRIQYDNITTANQSLTASEFRVR